ncbi:MAG TPA: hypothetical protein VIH58_00340 [Chthoniobacterales bacterium]|jgi:hypothetical protein
MKRVLFKTWRSPELILVLGVSAREVGLEFKRTFISFGIAGISLLLASCANTNEKTANINSAFPINYSTGARGFEAQWPYGPAGYH